MKLTALSLLGCHLVTVDRASDERGYFARLWCRQSLAQAGIEFAVEQTSASFNHQAGTVRGMHFVWPPAQESKLVRCARGRLHDVLLDLRPGSATYLQSTAAVLDADEHNALLVPPGVAHGFQTLVDNTEVHYMMNEAYRPALSDGVRFDDPRFGMAWPLAVACISERDRSYADFDNNLHCARMQTALAGAGHAA